MIEVAVIDDNADTRFLLRYMLSRDWGAANSANAYKLAEYAGGAEALAAFANLRPDVILLDISLPDLDGPAVLQRLRADPLLSPIPVVAVTGHAFPGDREKYLALGFNGYLAKPICDPKDVLAAITSVLSPDHV